MITLLLALSLGLLTACGDQDDPIQGSMGDRFVLKNELTACERLYGISVEGYDIGKFRLGSKAVFLPAILSAKTVLDNAASSESQIRTAITNLYAARDLFVSKKYDMYWSLVDKSKNTYDNAVEAVVPGDGQFDTGAKAAFISEWNTYSPAITNESTPPETRIAAWTSLRSAYVVFLSKQRMTAIKISTVSCNPSDKLTGDTSYVPAGTYRYIELFNNSNEDVDITGWSLQTTKYVFNADGSPNGEIKKRNFDAKGTAVIVKAKGYLLISKDSVWAAGLDPDFVLDDIDFIMGDGGRGIALVRANDVLVSNRSPLIVDAVGYSNATPAAGYYEGPPLTNTTMIIRKWATTDTLKDTDVNADDFYNTSTNTTVWRLPRNSQWTGDCTWTW